MRQIHYFYKITNLINGKFYYGIRSCYCLPGKDPYMGSGTILHSAYKKYGIDNFKKEILRICKTREDASDLERWIVTEELAKNTNCYNIIVGGDNPKQFYGGVRCYFEDKYVIVSNSEYKKNKDLYKSVIKGKVLANINGKNTFVDTEVYRNDNLELSYQYLRKGEVIVFDNIIGKYIKITSIEYHKNRDRYKMPSELNKPSEDVKKRISDTMKILVKNGKNDHLKRRKWMNNGIESKRILEEDIFTYQSQGWVFGRMKS